MDRIKLFRSFAMWTVLRIAGVVIALVALARGVPLLIDEHDDLLFALAITLIIGLPLFSIWASVGFYFSFNRLGEKLKALKEKTL